MSFKGVSWPTLKMSRWGWGGLKSTITFTVSFEFCESGIILYHIKGENFQLKKKSLQQQKKVSKNAILMLR